ncbi:MAG: prephenate dehydrogenase/arogenate dehydrogenase family protein [Ruminococcaceae bacterium]|nr:prephenate dehydrogenase/arogenate dehydrogenase family protein [Oscillospiraceae bacterium]
MVIGIVGLGLIGGSLAKAYKKSNNTVYGFDIDTITLQYAIMTGTLDAALTQDTLKLCDAVFIALYPDATVEYILKNQSFFKKDSIVIDCCGVKEKICSPCFDIADKNNFHFVGGHPMAGLQNSGYKNSKEDLFCGANMILVPKKNEDIALLSKIKDILVLAGFESVSVTSAQNHDKIIAYTSQLAHVVSNAYVKSPSAAVHHGFSAGSYKDLTRVAQLSAEMWTQLFMDNKENLLFEIDSIINSLNQYKDAIKSNDRQALFSLLKEGSDRKVKIDKNELE